MPSLGSDMEDGTLIEWEKQLGDTVNRGDIIAVVETQKGAIEIEVYEDGVLEKVLVNLGDKLPVGTPLAIIGDNSEFRSSDSGANSQPLNVLAEHASQHMAANPSASENPLSSSDGGVSGNSTEKPFPVNSAQSNEDNEYSLAAAHQTDSLATAFSAGERVRATPAAKKLALDSNINLVSITGSGPESAIVLDDVKAAVRAKERSKPDATAEAVAQPTAMHDKTNNNAKTKSATMTSSMDGMRAAIAAAMSRSKREIPHYYLSHTAQLDKLMTYVSENNAQRAPDDRLIPGALFIKAVALAVSKFPEFNGHYNNGQYTASEAIHIGVRKGRFKAAEINDPTLTISSLGDRGVESLFGVIFPPQVAIIGFGTPVSSVKIGDDGNIAPMHTTTVTLAADHRVSDGHRGALFLRTIGRHLNEPEKLQ